jgi:hypothetical protein
MLKEISFNDSNDIIIANPTIDFIQFSNCENFLHNLVKDHFIPTKGYILLKNKKNLKLSIGSYTLNDIYDIYNLNDKINISYINNLNSNEELEMNKCQNSIINSKSKYTSEEESSEEEISDE